jgi:hypothetical protein
LGLIQIPRYRAAAELASGKLMEVLPQFPRRRCRFMSSIHTPGNCRRACGW